MTEIDVDVGGRVVRVSSLDRILWPYVGFTKADMLDYYVSAAPALLPHLAGRPLTLHRFPDGVGGPHFFQTRTPPHPAWVRTATMQFPRTGKTFDVPIVDNLPALVWATNLSTVELHPFLARAERLDQPTVAVFDLDPGLPAELVAACRVALLVRAELDSAGLQSWPKTSGGKGLHVYVPLNTAVRYDQTKAFARELARRLAGRHPDQVVDRMTRSLRPGKVLVDWSQNDPGKSTVAPYSLRALRVPTVSMPVTWDEVTAVATGGDGRLLAWGPAQALRRLATVGDLFAPVLSTPQCLP